jgi:hypothetical protein
MTKEIILNTGKPTLVDDTDFDWLNQYHWSSLCDHRYAARSAYSPETKRANIVYMHRMIMDPAEGMTVDHIDRDGFNNQRSNLRIASLSQNLRNRPGYGASGYRGVRRGSAGNKDAWIVRFTCDEIDIHIGVFYNIDDGARAYDAYAAVYGDEFSIRNFPDETPLSLDEAGQLLLTQHRKNPSKQRMSSQYRGVSFYPTRGYWRAALTINGQTLMQRYFKTEIEAARCFDAAAREHHGALARLNFPNEVSN